MNIKYYYLVRIAEKTNPFVSHFHCAMMYLSKQLYSIFKFLSVEFYLRISHLNWRQFFRLTMELLLLSFEIFQTVAHIASLYLFSPKIFYLACCFLYVIFAELNQT